MKFCYNKQKPPGTSMSQSIPSVIPEIWCKLEEFDAKHGTHLARFSILATALRYAGVQCQGQFRKFHVLDIKDGNFITYFDAPAIFIKDTLVFSRGLEGLGDWDQGSWEDIRADMKVHLTAWALRNYRDPPDLDGVWSEEPCAVSLHHPESPDAACAILIAQEHVAQSLKQTIHENLSPDQGTVSRQPKL